MTGSVSWLVVLGFALTACGGSSQPASSAGETQGASRAGTWKQVVVMQGDGGQPVDTQAFELNGGKIRFVYTVQQNGTGSVPFLTQVLPGGAPVGASEVHRTSCLDCKGEQTDEAGAIRAGGYYLHIVTSRSWKMTVYEQL
jgi:hypothetical protein